MATIYYETSQQHVPLMFDNVEINLPELIQMRIFSQDCVLQLVQKVEICFVDINSKSIFFRFDFIWGFSGDVCRYGGTFAVTGDVCRYWGRLPL